MFIRKTSSNQGSCCPLKKIRFFVIFTHVYIRIGGYFSKHISFDIRRRIDCEL
jgi:hypothetical protein